MEHVHRWKLEAPTGPTVLATCMTRGCPDKSREFFSGWEESFQRAKGTRKIGAKLGDPKVHGGWR